MKFVEKFIKLDFMKNLLLLTINLTMVILQCYGRLSISNEIEMLAPVIAGAGSSVLFGTAAVIYVAIKLHKEKK